MKLWPVVTGVAIALTLVACKSPTPPKGVQPISLEQVTATYGARSDGGISVVNRGYDPVKKRWNESDGKAYFTGAPTTAALKVSFFGPFYGGYNVIRLDDDYQYALVSGPNRDYLWILSRGSKQDYLNTARELGFDVDRLVWIRQTPR